MKKEYRVVWKRKPFISDEHVIDPRPKVRRYATRKGAETFMLLLGPEPWKGYAPGVDPDSYVCCSGQECCCGGQTYREKAEGMRKTLPPIAYIRLEERVVGDWKVPVTPHAVTQLEMPL